MTSKIIAISIIFGRSLEVQNLKMHFYLIKFLFKVIVIQTKEQFLTIYLKNSDNFETLYL